MAIIKSGEERQVFATSFIIKTNCTVEDGKATISLGSISIQVGEVGLESGTIQSQGNKSVNLGSLSESQRDFLALADTKFREMFEEVMNEEVAEDAGEPI